MICSVCFGLILKCKVVPAQAMMIRRGGGDYLHSFLIWTLDGSKWLASRSGRFTSWVTTLAAH